MDTLFSIKKILGVLISPLPIALIFMLIGLFYLFTARTGDAIKKARIYMCTGMVILIIVSSPIASFLMLRPIELAYPKYQDQYSHVDNIVVLGCYNSSDKKLPDLANVHPCSLYRLVEALRLSNLYPEAQIYLTGWGKSNEQRMSHPAFSAKVLSDLGINTSQLTIIEGPKDTEDEVNTLKPFLQGKVNLVVSSASHFYRAIKLFEDKQIEVTPVPVEYLTHQKANWKLSWYLFVPDPDALVSSKRAVYEYLGNLWVRIKSWFL